MTARYIWEMKTPDDVYRDTRRVLMRIAAERSAFIAAATVDPVADRPKQPPPVVRHAPPARRGRWARG